jgi:hypothetical protein
MKPPAGTIVAATTPARQRYGFLLLTTARAAAFTLAAHLR